jgi:hypothetical protein
VSSAKRNAFIKGETYGFEETHPADNGRAFAQRTGKGETAMPFYEKGNVRIHYEEAGSGFPLLLIPGGGLNSTIAWNAKGAPFNPVEEFRNEYRCMTADLRNAYSG